MVAYQSGSYLLVTLMEGGEADFNNSLNAYMIAEGFATLDKAVQSDEIPAEMQSWSEF